MKELTNVFLMYKILVWIKLVTRPFKIRESQPALTANAWELVERSQKDSKILESPGLPGMWICESL